MVREHVAVKNNVQIALLASVLIFSKGKITEDNYSKYQTERTKKPLIQNINSSN